MNGIELERDVPTVRIFSENQITLGISSILGTRKNQEDAVYAYTKEKNAIAIVCDGMGGLNGGETASNTAVKSLAEAYFLEKQIRNIPEFLERQALKADEEVFLLEDETGEALQAGTTIASVIIQEGKLHWLSVGDSRIYIIRGDEIMAVNQEHNYRMKLDALLEGGSITEEEYKREEHRAEALISYIGMGNMSLMDINRQPFILEDEDIVLLSSDGLYRSLSDEDILGIVLEAKEDTQSMAEQLTRMAMGDKQSGQDNTSVVALQYHEAEHKIN